VKSPARKGRINYGSLYTMPLVVWFTLFFLIPLLVIVLFSFLKADIDGGVLPEFSLAAFTGLVKPRIFKLFLTTGWVSFASTLITILLALPCAYYMARSKAKNVLLILVIIPFWTNFIIRIFAWKSILESNGVINSVLMGLGIVSSPLSLEHNWFAVIIINVYTYLTYAILPLFSTIDKFDFTLLEAARDLGASKLQAIVKVLLPNVKAGIVTAVFFTLPGNTHSLTVLINGDGNVTKAPQQSNYVNNASVTASGPSITKSQRTGIHTGLSPTAISIRPRAHA